MKSYIGCKVILAEKMDLGIFNARFGRSVKPKSGGFRGYHVIYPDGYDSWSPKDVFEHAYREFSAQERELISWEKKKK